jgi:phage baseplate assembly protein gpV
VSASLFETLQRIVREELGRLRTVELAVVQEQHPHEGESDTDNYACTVVLRDSGLVLRQVPVATGRMGAVSIPAAGDLVLVQFVGGDLNAPVVTGSVYNDEDRPPVNADGQAILHLPLGAADSDAVHLEIASGDARLVKLRLGDGLELLLQDDDPVVDLSVAGGKAKITIDRDGAVKIETQGKLAVESKDSIAMKAPKIEIKADGQLDLKGGTVNLN